jgi:Kef-type K+ transport system membrane component KefB/Trk K+ transport system NAD-binding subunit
MGPFMEISSILALAAIVSLLMHRLRQPLMLGYILTGILVGPFAFGMLHAHESFEVFSEFAVAILLFVIGLNLRPQVMREVSRTSFVLGIAQVGITLFLGYLAALGLGMGWLPAVYLAAGVTFSSTILATKLLTDAHETGKLHGKIAIGILLVQDVVASIALVLFVSARDGASISGTLVSAFLKSLILFFFFAFVARIVMPRLERVFGQSAELLLLITFVWGVGMAALYAWLGLSMEMGALCAGAVLASSTYQPEIVSKMKLLRDFFLVLFFIALGAQLNFALGAALWWSVVALSVFVLLVKPVLVLGIMGLVGYHRHTSFRVGLQLAQVSEFSLVFVLYGLRIGQADLATVSILTLTALVSMAVSTALNHHADVLYDRLEGVLRVFERRGVKRPSHDTRVYDAVLFGSHRVGSDLIPALRQLVKRYFVVDADPDVLVQLARQHVPCGFGDVGDEMFLQEFAWKRVKIVVSTVPSTEDNLCLLSVVRKSNPEAVVMVVAQTLAEAESLYAAGATYVIMPHFLGSRYISRLLSQLGSEAQNYEAERRRHRRMMAEKTVQTVPLVRRSAGGVH